MCRAVFVFFFFKQKTAYEMRISDWSSDVCSSDLASAKACLPQNSQNAEDRMVVPDFRPPSAQARFIPQRTKASGAACGGMSSSAPHHDKIGRASCRERVGPYV